jgi:uncharacterized protein YydD (DUF2326 family)
MTLAPEVQERIERIEEELKRIDRDIRALRKEREEVLRSDEEYASYVDWYEGYYEDLPLSIHQYYERSAELAELNKKFNDVYHRGDTEAYEDCWRKNEVRLLQLERMLAA